MNLKGLRIFSLVIEEGTLAQAAAKVHLSQPAASRLLVLLEEELNVRLFLRDKQRLIPTPEGELFYPEAVRILASIDEIPEFFASIRRGSTLPLRIISHPRVINGLVVPAMSELAKQQPELEMQLGIHPRRVLGRRIINDRFDIGISTLPLPVDDLTTTPIGQTSLHIVVSKQHPFAQEKHLTLKQLANESYIALDKHTIIRNIVDQALLKEAMQLTPRYEVSAATAAYRLACRNLGFAFADPVVIDPELKECLALIPCEPMIPIQFGFFLPKSKPPHQATDALVECLKQTYQKALHNQPI